MGRKKQPYNKQFDEVKYSKVCRYNKDLLEDWLFEKKAEGMKQSTLEKYESNIKSFYIWIYDNMDNRPIWQMKKKQFRNYLLYLQELGLSPARILTIKSSISSMLTYAEDDEDYDEIEQNYMGKIKGMKKTETREILFLTDEQIKLLYDYLKEAKRYQELLMLALLYDTGARKSEIFAVERDYINVEGNVTTKKVIGKRGKKFPLYYHARTIEAYKLYMETREDDSNYLWIARNGEPMSKDNFYPIVKKWNKILEKLTGEDLGFDVHTFRHSFATNMQNGTHYVCKENGGLKLSLNEIQVILNHESPETTQSYIKKDDEEIIARAFRWDKK